MIRALPSGSTRSHGGRPSGERQAGAVGPSIVHDTTVVIGIAYKDAIEIADLDIDGSDLEELGISGPEVGVTLRKLLQAVINDPKKNNRSELIKMARRSLPSP